MEVQSNIGKTKKEEAVPSTWAQQWSREPQSIQNNLSDIAATLP